MFLYHYFTKDQEPFLNLSDLSDENAQKIMDNLKDGKNMYSIRDADGKYLFYRHNIEKWLYSTFLEKGGKPNRKNPHYLILGESNFLKNNYNWNNNVDVIKIPVMEIGIDKISFTYGDTYQIFDPTHDNTTAEYWRKLYTYDEIQNLIKKLGLPENVPRNKDTPWWLPSYIEAQVWDDEILMKYKEEYNLRKKHEEQLQ